MTSTPVRQAVALVAALTTACFCVNAPVLAAAEALLSGRVVDKDGFTPRSGVVVTLVDRTDQQRFDSSPTNTEGAFRIDSAPAGRYAVLAKAEEGTYLATEELALAEGSNPPMQLSLDAATQPQLVPGQTQQDELPSWAKGLIAGTLVVAAYVLYDHVTETEASRQNPF